LKKAGCWLGGPRDPMLPRGRVMFSRGQARPPGGVWGGRLRKPRGCPFFPGPFCPPGPLRGLSNPKRGANNFYAGRSDGPLVPLPGWAENLVFFEPASGVGGGGAPNGLGRRGHGAFVCIGYHATSSVSQFERPPADWKARQFAKMGVLTGSAH